MVEVTIENVLVRLEEQSSELVLSLVSGGKIVYQKPIDLFCDAVSYGIEDIMSGKSGSGDCFLSFAIIAEEEEERDIPYAREIAIRVNKDGSCVEYGFNPWHNSETESYYEYDSGIEDFSVKSFVFQIEERYRPCYC